MYYIISNVDKNTSGRELCTRARRARSYIVMGAHGRIIEIIIHARTNIDILLRAHAFMIKYCTARDMIYITRTYAMILSYTCVYVIFDYCVCGEIL